MRKLIQVIAVVIILLGVLHMYFAFPIQLNTDTLWFVGTGMGIIFAGLLNLVAIHGGGSIFTYTVAIITNFIACALFGFALVVLREPQVYFGVAIFLLSAVVFLIVLFKHKK